MYYIVLLIGILLLFIPIQNKKKEIIFLVLMILLAVFRYGVGPDYFSYNYLYNATSTSIFYGFTQTVFRGEPAFKLLMILSRKIGLSYQMFISMIAFVTLLLTYRASLKYSKKPIISLFTYYSLFYFVWTFSALRQGIAIAIILNAITYYIDQQNMKKVIGWIIVASLFHYSALITLPILFLAKKQYSLKTFLIMIGVAYLVSLIPVTSVLVKLEWIPLVPKIVYYIGGEGFSLGLNFQLFGRLAFLAIGLLMYQKYILISEQNRVLMNFYILGLIMFVAMNNLNLINARLSIYAFTFFIIIISSLPILELIDTKYYKKLSYLFIVLLSMLYFAKEINSMAINSKMIKESSLVPYTTIFNKDKVEFNNRYKKLILNDGGIR